MKRTGMIKQGVFLLLLSSVVTAFTPAQQLPVDASEMCYAQLKTAYEKMRTPAVSKDKVFYMNYDVKSVVRYKEALMGKNPPAAGTMHVELFSNEEQTHFLSGQMTVLMDKKEVISILPAQKTVYRLDNPYQKGDMSALTKQDSYRQLQDTFLKISKVIECVPTTEAGADKKITLKPQGKKATLFDLEEVTYYINTRKEEIRKVKLHYAASRDVESVEITYNEIDYDYQKKKLKGSVSDLVFKKDRLNANYSGYKLIDKRKSSL